MLTAASVLETAWRFICRFQHYTPNGDKQKWWALAALAFVASFSVRYEICEPSQYHRFKECARHNIPYIIWHFIEVHNGVVVAVATGVIAIFTITLSRSTSRTLAHLERQFIAEHRPHIGVSPRIKGAFQN